MASTNDPTPARGKAMPAVLPFLVWLAFLALLRMLPPDGREHGDAAQFLGRFHVLLVHAPLVVLVLVPFFELAATRGRTPGMGAAAGALLSFAALATFVTALDGWLLAWAGGYRGQDVTRHMWAAFFLVGFCAAASLARCGALPRPLYPALLTATLALVVWTGHTGGTLSHGAGYLTAHLPRPVRGWLGLAAQAPAGGAAAAEPAVKAGPGSVDPANPAYYSVHIAPLFARSCVSCHKPQKHKGGLLLDSYAHLMKGGDDGPAVVPGNAKASDLVRRVKLPPSDDDSMPSDGDKPLAPEEIEMVERWIAAGAKS
jgi:hypothetical protein